MKQPSHKAPVYAWMFPYLSEVARKHGYALGLHGSMNRDLDLMAMPWVEEAVPPEELVEALRAAIDARVLPDGTPIGKWDGEKFVSDVLHQPDHKPHGRMAWNIHMDCGFFIDLSIMPRAK